MPRPLDRTKAIDASIRKNRDAVGKVNHGIAMRKVACVGIVIKIPSNVIRNAAQQNVVGIFVGIIAKAVKNPHKTVGQFFADVGGVAVPVFGNRDIIVGGQAVFLRQFD